MAAGCLFAFVIASRSIVCDCIAFLLRQDFVLHFSRFVNNTVKQYCQYLILIPAFRSISSSDVKSDGKILAFQNVCLRSGIASVTQ